jgi:tetratricopeptide (TPR) repeat protein
MPAQDMAPSSPDSHRADVAAREKDLKAARDLGDELIVGSKFVALGKAHLWPDEEKLALDCFNQALTTMRAAGGDQEGEAAALQGIGEVYIRLGEMQKALTNLNRALALWRAAHDQYDEVRH